MITRSSSFKRLKAVIAILLALASLRGFRPTDAESQSKAPSAATKIRLAVPAPSLSYLPIYAALQQGFFARRGFDMEVVQMSAGLAAPALLNRAIDYTTVPSGLLRLAREERRSRSFAFHRSNSSIF
jgi:ABC-type nitrate/sulfonate/bicarbonate transport system substrate-binding protein